jgi:hypothetical protein
MELEQYLEEHYWSEDDLLRELRADIDGAALRSGQRRGRTPARCWCLAGARACSARHAVQLQRHLDGARAAPPDGISTPSR